jgi:hypothetical protein
MDWQGLLDVLTFDFVDEDVLQGVDGLARLLDVLTLTLLMKTLYKG